MALLASEIWLTSYKLSSIILLVALVIFNSGRYEGPVTIEATMAVPAQMNPGPRAMAPQANPLNNGSSSTPTADPPSYIATGRKISKILNDFFDVSIELLDKE